MLFSSLTKRENNILIFFILIFVSIIIYSNSLYNKFVYDDTHTIVDNVFIKSPKYLQ